MLDLENLISTLDYILDSRSKRHIVGGVLLSVSLMFAGLSVTTLTLKIRKDDENE